MYSYEEIAEQFGISRESARLLVVNALRKLRKKITIEEVGELLREHDEQKTSLYEVMVDELNNIVMETDSLRGFWKEQNNI